MELLREKQADYWLLSLPDSVVVDEEPKLKTNDFIMGPFDAEYLGEHPPESDWSNWFPSPPRMTEGELEVLTDWVEVEAEKHELNLILILIPLKTIS